MVDRDELEAGDFADIKLHVQLHTGHSGMRI